MRHFHASGQIKYFHIQGKVDIVYTIGLLAEVNINVNDIEIILSKNAASNIRLASRLQLRCILDVSRTFDALGMLALRWMKILA